MSAKNNDAKGRHRSETIAFRCSPEERAEIDKRWKLCGYSTKQDYELDSVLHSSITESRSRMVLQLLLRYGLHQMKWRM